MVLPYYRFAVKQCPRDTRDPGYIHEQDDFIAWYLDEFGRGGRSTGDFVAAESIPTF